MGFQQTVEKLWKRFSKLKQLKQKNDIFPEKTLYLTGFSVGKLVGSVENSKKLGLWKSDKVKK